MKAQSNKNTIYTRARRAGPHLQTQAPGAVRAEEGNSRAGQRPPVQSNTQRRLRNPYVPDC